MGGRLLLLGQRAGALVLVWILALALVLARRLTRVLLSVRATGQVEVRVEGLLADQLV